MQIDIQVVTPLELSPEEQVELVETLGQHARYLINQYAAARQGVEVKTVPLEGVGVN